MSEMPLEDVPALAELAHQAAEGGEVVYLTEHGQRVAAVMPAEAYENTQRLREEAEIAQAIAASLADTRPGKVFASVEDMINAADLL